MKYQQQAFQDPQQVFNPLSSVPRPLGPIFIELLSTKMYTASTASEEGITSAEFGGKQSHEIWPSVRVYCMNHIHVTAPSAGPNLILPLSLICDI